MEENVENLVRNLKLPQLEVLKLLADSEYGISSNKEISNTTSTASYTLGGILAPLRRYKVNGESLIIPAGKDPDEGTRWQINEKLVKREELKRLLVKMGI